MAALLLALCAASLPAAARAASIKTVMGLDGEEGRDWADSAFFPRVQAMTGVGIGAFWQYRDDAAYQDAKRKALAGEAPLPDVFFKADLTPQEELTGATDGTLVDVAPLLAEHAPNLSTLLDAHPDWRAAITLPDGKIVALPTLATAERQVVIWINKNWLDALGLPTPTTPQDYRAALIAMRDGDPNGNGKRDEIPLRAVGPWDIKWLQAFFGLAANDYNIYMDAQGVVRFAPLQPAFGDFLAYAKDLFREGLLGADAFGTSNAALALDDKDALALRMGGLISLAPYTLLNMGQATAFTALPPMAYEGRTVYRDLQGPVWRGSFAITRACEDPAAALRWVDALYTPQGGILAWAGLEGEDFAWRDADHWGFLTQEGMRPESAILTEALMTGGAAMPGLQPYDFWGRIDIEAERHVMAESAKVAPFAALPAPLVYWDAAQQQRLDTLQAVLGPAVDVGIARFVTGETPLDEAHLTAFQGELRALGADELTALWQHAQDAGATPGESFAKP
jgi:putative aldouronate transport system substrate-binding protein